MILNCLNYGANEFFEDKNLVFRGGRFGGRGRIGGRAEVSGSAGAEAGRSPEQAPQDPFEALKKLHRDVDRRRAEVKAHPGYHRRPHEQTRDDLDPVTARNPETRAIAERQLELQGLMSIEQIETMERSHDAISAHYMNPAFMLYMNSLNNAPELSSQDIYRAMDVVLEHPYDFEYSYNETDKTVSIKKKGTSTVADVRLVIQLGDRAGENILASVNGKSLKVDGRYPWENVDYQSSMQRYKEQFDFEWSEGVYPAFFTPGGPDDNPDDAERARIYGEMQMEAFNKVTPEMQEIYLHNHVTIPLRFIQLVKARNYDFEKNNEVFKLLEGYEIHLRSLQNSPRAEAYRRITQNREQELNVMTLPDGEIPGTYSIVMVDHDDQTLVIDKNGMILKEDANGFWVPDPRYGVKLRNGYYTANASRNAENLIEGEAFKSRLKAAGLEAVKLEELLQNRELVRVNKTLFDEALKTADWDKIKDVAYLVVRNNATRVDFDKFFSDWEPYKNDADTLAPGLEAMRERIILELPENNRQTINDVAVKLGITLAAPNPTPAPTPATTPPAPPTSQ